MALYIVQHGKSHSKEADPQRSLSPEGERETRLIASVAKGYQVKIFDILHSGKKRARQTAGIFGEIMGYEGQLKAEHGLNPLDDPGLVAGNLENRNTMVVGHLPFLEKLISQLVTGKEDHCLFKLQNSGIVCLDRAGDQPPWYIKWALMPNIS